MWWDLASSGDRWKGADTDKLTWTVSNADGTDGIGLPAITEADEGRIVMVKDGAYSLESSETIVKAAVTLALNTEV